jgi:hypothetical protein
MIGFSCDLLLRPVSSDGHSSFSFISSTRMFSTNGWNLVETALYHLCLSFNIQEMGLTGILSISLAAILYIQHCPLIYYAYAGFPVFFWEEVLANRETLKQGLRVLMQGEGKRVSLLTIASQSLLYIGILESLVQFFLI